MYKNNNPEQWHDYAAQHKHEQAQKFRRQPRDPRETKESQTSKLIHTISRDKLKQLACVK